MSETYDIGTRAWQPDLTEGWVASEVVNKTVNGDKVSLVFELENGEVSSDLDQIACDCRLTGVLCRRPRRLRSRLRA